MAIQQRAWVRLPSGNRLDLLNPSPGDWSDSDLALGLSRNYRWGGQSGDHDYPLSVAQHSLTVMALLDQMTPGGLTPKAKLRELLHDGDESFFTEILTPLKHFLGEPLKELCSSLQATVFKRYDVAHWNPEEYKLHKRADIIAAASEAVHVAGWSPEEVRDILEIKELPIAIDPLQAIYGGEAWAPWAPKVARDRFLAELVRLQNEIKNTAANDPTNVQPRRLRGMR